nr:hypothetical protein [uncultured Desulfobulbus sp.]
MLVAKKRLKTLVVSVLLLLGATVYAFAFLGIGDSATWQEEVLLHDGSKIIAKRSLNYGGRHEIGQSSPIREQNIKFDLPDSGKTINWTSEYSEDIERANFNLLAVHILNNIPYIVAEPNLCLSYNKWGRPNPPYVIFRYNENSWQRISIEEFPAEFKTINVALAPKTHEKKLTGQGLVSAEMVKQLNSDLKQPYLKSILRTPLEPGAMGISCEVLIEYKCKGGHIGWGSPGGFSKDYFDKLCK